MPVWKEILRNACIALTIGGLLFGACCWVVGQVVSIPPRDMTRLRMVTMLGAIGTYVQQNRELPTSLEPLLNPQAGVLSTNDGWRRPLIYVMKGDGHFVLTSLGRDGKRGGAEQDLDWEIEAQLGDDGIQVVRSFWQDDVGREFPSK